MQSVNEDVLSLTPGICSLSANTKEMSKRERILRATVEFYSPEVIRLIEKATKNKAIIALHQDAFAVGLDKDEYTLLGMVIKYIGLHGVQILFVGQNEENVEKTTQVFDN